MRPPVCNRCGCCGGARGAYSHRLGYVACRDCYHAAFVAEALAEADRVERQRMVAAGIRAAGRRLGDDRQRRRLADQALIIETASSVHEVDRALREVERLGMKVGRRWSMR